MPAMSKSDVLILPITFDKAVGVRDTEELGLETTNFGGFLAVTGDGGIVERTLVVEKRTDYSMLTRVVASNLCLVVFIVLLIPTRRRSE